MANHRSYPKDIKIGEEIAVEFRGGPTWLPVALVEKNQGGHSYTITVLNEDGTWGGFNFAVESNGKLTVR